MCDFVTLCGGDLKLGPKICALRVKQEGTGPAGDETPIFHGTCIKVAGLEEKSELFKTKKGDQETLTTRVSSLGRGYSTSNIFSYKGNTAALTSRANWA